MPDGSPARRKLLRKLKAIKIVEVIKETGQINIREAHRRMYPNQNELSHKTHADDMYKDGVMDEVERLLQIRDKDLMKKITPEVIVQDIVDDLTKLNELRDSGKISTEEIVKVLNAKAGKQKLLGMAIGVWKSEKPAEREATADELMKELTKIGGSSDAK